MTFFPNNLTEPKKAAGEKLPLHKGSRPKLFNDAGNNARTYSTATFTDSET